MKNTILTITILAFILSSCNNNKKDEHTSEPNLTEETSQTHQKNSILNNNWIDDIELDNGAKWLANEETNIGVQKMKDILESHVTLELDEYHQLAIELTHAKNYVIKECTMKGPSHDYLHVWLLPLLEKIEALSESKTIEEASEIKQSIIENVNAYDAYFK